MRQIHTFRTSGQSERSQGPNDPKDILCIKRSDLALGRVGTVNRQLRARGRDNLLLLGPSKLT